MTTTHVDELALARAKRQRRACPDFDPQTHFAAVERHVHTFVAAHRRNVEHRGRLAELEFTVDCLTDPTGARSFETHLSAVANMLAVAVDMLAQRRDENSDRTGRPNHGHQRGPENG